MAQKAMERKEKEESNSVCVSVKHPEAGSLDITKSPQSVCKTAVCENMLWSWQQGGLHPYSSVGGSSGNQEATGVHGHSDPSIPSITVVYLITDTSHSDSWGTDVYLVLGTVLRW